MQYFLKVSGLMLALVLVGAGCGGLGTDITTEADVDTDVDAGVEVNGDVGTEADADADAAVSSSAQLREQNNSGESGTVTLSQQNGTTVVELQVQGAPAGHSQPAHIHLGSCAEIGSIAFPLQNVVNGESITTVSATIAEILAVATDVSVNVHLSNLEIGNYVACADLEA